MYSVIEKIEALSNARGALHKQSLLSTFNDGNDLFTEVLKFIYNPYCKTGFSSKKFGNAVVLSLGINVGNPCVADTELLIVTVIDYLKHNTSGNMNDLTTIAKFVATMRSLYGDKGVEFARALVTQKLTIGVSTTTLNNVYGEGFIPVVGCMLGTSIDKVKWTDGNYIATEKLDGIRRLLIKEKGVCRMYSRSGHEDTGLYQILEEAEHLPDNCVYDGELLAIGDFSDSIALRQATASLANCKGRKQGLSFNVFDMIPCSEYFSGSSKSTALQRKLRLGATLGDESIGLLSPEVNVAQNIVAFKDYDKFEYIKPVPILGMISCKGDISNIVAPIWQRGGEGIMLNKADGKYEVKRSKALLKVKKVQSVLLTVTGMNEGSGKFEGMLGNLIVDYKGNKLGVGSGLTEAERIEIWNNKEDYIGSIVEVDTFGESTNAMGLVSLNCPIFKRFYGGEE